jgi:hypothetical protein
VAAQQLQKELEDLAAQLQALMQDSECLSRFNQEQGEWLLTLEWVVEIWNKQAEDQKILKTIDNDPTTINHMLLQNCQLKEQLDKLQDGFIRLITNNVELTSALH